MSSNYFDFQDADPQQSGFDLIPKGAVVPVRMTIKPGGYDDPDKAGAAATPPSPSKPALSISPPRLSSRRATMPSARCGATSACTPRGADLGPDGAQLHPRRAQQRPQRPPRTTARRPAAAASRVFMNWMAWSSGARGH